jgi:xanthine/CO dehydrogenase XdhC/CoxF family maturation factor
MIAADGTVAGSVSGGRVEAAVYELATEVLRTRRPQLRRYDISADDDTFAVGLTCGGEIEAIAAQCPIAVATAITHPDPGRLGRRLVITFESVQGWLGSARSDAAVADDARGLPSAGRTAVLTYGPEGQRQWPHRYLAAQAGQGGIDARTVICVLTHDPKFDVPVLQVALRLPRVGYVGTMGSRRTHRDRVDRLRGGGRPLAEVDGRIHHDVAP